jgi:transcription elongation factor S-II
MDAKEIRTAVTNLDKARNDNDTNTLKDILKQLENGVVASESLLRETKVGVHVNKLRTHEDNDVVDLVKKIIKKWKDHVSAEKKKKKVTTINEPSSSSTIKKESQMANTAEKIIENNKSIISKGPRTPITDDIKIEVYPDTTRNRSISALYTAVALNTNIESSIILKTCTNIELAIFKTNKDSINDSYRNKLRSLILNIKNKNNQPLRTNILNGAITPEKLINMTSAELAPESLKKELEQLHQKNLFDAQGAVEKRAVTDRFVCGKCKQREVSYYQMQTRSADEPLTTFCTCEKCGNRWKFC